jgi:serine/threonine protein kinase/WD40 repeat protein
MNPDPELVEAIFSDALERSSVEEREAFLDESCSHDESLRQRVETLLRAHQDARHFLQALIPSVRSLTGDETLDTPRAYDQAFEATHGPSDHTRIDELVAPTVPGYELHGEVGRGGMGVVYKARQLDLNRIVALKMVLAGSHAGSIDLVRFHAEAEVAANLQHPNIVQVHAVGRHAGLPYLSLEYVEGGTLSQRLNGVPQKPQAAVALIEILARAVQHAHDHGIVHRDIKPSNILMTADGKPKIADFGLAKRVECGTGMTQTGAILGTPSYMAPEQAESKKDIGPAADIYALGAILYEMLTGRPPFQALTPVDTIMQVIVDEPVPPRRLQPKLSRDLETICLKCLQKKPSQRYLSAQALADDLSRFQDGRPILARPVSKFERARRWCRRNPVVAGLSAACTVGVVVAAILLSQERTKTIDNLHRAESAEQDLTRQLELTNQAKQETTEQLWKSFRETADAKRFSHRPGQRFVSLESLAKAAQIARSLGKGDDVIEDLRRKAIGSLVLSDLRLEKELPGWNTDMTEYAIDRVFARYALRDKHGSVSVRRVADGREIQKLTANKKEVGRFVLELSPDGRYLAFDSPAQPVCVWDLDQAVSIPFPRGNASSAQAFTLDSQRIIFALNAGGFKIFSLPAGKLEQHFEGTPPGCGLISFAPDGRQFAACFPANGVIQFRSMESGQLLGSIKSEDTNSVSWSPDGRLVAVANRGVDGLVQLWDVANRKRVGSLDGHKNLGVLAAFNPAGNLVASAAWDNTFRLWDPLTTRQLLIMPSYGYLPIFNRGGDRILLCPKDLEIWEVANGSEYRTFSGDPLRRMKSPFGGSVSPDGRLLATGTYDGTMIWDMATGDELAYLPTGVTWHVLFHTSGDLLTSSRNTGLMRWRIRVHPGAVGEYTIGPPERLISYPTDGLSQSKDGRAVFAAISGVGGQVINLEDPGSSKPPLRHVGTNKCSVSPDGRWAATGCWNGMGIRVWSVGGNKLETELEIEGSVIPYFSPDGRWLATKKQKAAAQLWKVGTWEQGSTLPEGELAFSPDGNQVAVYKNAVITLIELNSGRTLATLEDPNQDRIYWADYTPDGSQFITSTHEKCSVNIWDLRRIRAGLKLIDLDWDSPPFPVPPSATGPLKMNVAGIAPAPPIPSGNSRDNAGPRRRD